MIVDVQEGFVNERSEHVVDKIELFAKEWEASGRRVVATRFVNPPGSQYERLIRWTRVRSAPETNLMPQIASLSPVVIEKTTYTSLTPELRDLVGEPFSGAIFICGIATDGCVLKTAVDAFEIGWTPHVLSDLCASHAGEEIHEAGLLLTGRFIGVDQLERSDDLKERL